MKRIKSACLLQTVHFQLKEDVPHDIAARSVHEEVEHYKAQLTRNHTRYQIIDESEQPDGSVMLRLRKQYNSYNCDEYMQ